jgi:putative transposase
VFYHVIMQIWSFVLDLAGLSRLTTEGKDIEILLLRQQLRIVERRQQRGPHIPRWEKVPLAVLTCRLKTQAVLTREKLQASLRLFKPDTVLGWHRALVRRKWTFKQRRKPGRPTIDAELEQWIVRLAQDNPGLGFKKLEGELRKLGFEVSRATVRRVMRRHGILPAPERSRQSLSWRTFLNHYKKQILACDFFTIETMWLKTLYVLFFIEHASRCVHLAGCTPYPDERWAAQQARQMVWQLSDRASPIRYLIHDRDGKFTPAFDTVFRSEGIAIRRTPARAPNANAIAERWVRTVREECLDKLLIWNEPHLRRVLGEYVLYYNNRRPHQGLAQDSPLGLEVPSGEGAIAYRGVLGGVIRDYYREAA